MCLALDCAQLAKERVPLTEWRSDRLWVGLALALLVVLFARRDRSAARPDAETKRALDSATARQFWLAALSFSCVLRRTKARRSRETDMRIDVQTDRQRAGNRAR